MQRNVVYTFAISIVVIGLIMSGLPVTGTYNYKEGSVTGEIILYEDTHYAGIFDGSTGELGDTTISPYTRLWIQGHYANDISGGTFQNIDEIEFRNTSYSSDYLNYNYGNITDVNTVLVDCLLSTTYTITVKNVADLKLIQAADGPSIAFSPTVDVSGKKKIIIENSTITLNGYINFGCSNSELYINDTTIIVTQTTTYSSSGIVSIDNNYINEGVDNTKIHLSNVKFVLPNTFTGTLLDLHGIDIVEIDNITVDTDGLETIIRLNNNNNGYIKNCNLSYFRSSGITVGYIDSELIISNNRIVNALFDDSEKMPAGIASSTSDIITTASTTMPSGRIIVEDNIFKKVQVGIMASAEQFIIRNNTMSDFYKNVENSYGTTGIALIYTSTTVVSYVTAVVHRIEYNHIKDADVGLGMTMSAYATHNVVLNCTNAMLGSPALYNNYDGFSINAPYNYIGTDYPDINTVNNIDPLLASTGKYSGDIIDGSVSYEFQFSYEPFALTRHTPDEDMEFTINMDVGWNYVFCPYRINSDYTIGDLFNASPYIKVLIIRTIDGDYIPFFYMLPETFDRALPDVSGFYIFSTAPTEIHIPIAETKVLYTFKQGWNSLGYLLTGYTFPSWVERMENIEIVVYIDDYGNYVPIYIHHPLEPSEREELAKIDIDDGVFVFFNKDLQYTINPPLYDIESDTFIGTGG